jgi:hypothetical protein
MIEQLLTVLMLAAVVALIGAPLRRGRRATFAEPPDGAAEAAAEAKYREILETELDYRTGKLDEADYRAIDGALRREAVALARRRDARRGSR